MGQELFQRLLNRMQLEHVTNNHSTGRKNRHNRKSVSAEIERLFETISLIRWGGNINLLGQAILAKPHRFKKFFQQKFARCDGIKFFHNRSSLVVIYNFHIFCSRICPIKAYSKLIVYADAILTATITFECFETILGWHF